MKFEDFHTHSQLCHHAVGTIEDYIIKAIELKLNTIGISDHFPFEFLANIERIPYEDYAITLDEIDEYLSMIEGFKEKYRNKINIRTAFEVDFFENQEDVLNFHLDKIKDKLDYIIGSIHVLNFQDGKGAWSFDDNRFREDYNFYGPDKVYLLYYKKLREMISSRKFDFDIIGHFDLPKKFNDFPEHKELIFDEAIKALKLVKKKGITMEINTSGLRKDVKEQYPSEEILKKAFELDIPVLLGSDAHNPNDIAWEFKKIIKMLKRIGYNQIAHFDKRKMTFKEI